MVFSKVWKASKSARKQRNYRENAPIHIKGKFLSSHLNAELRKKHNMRNIRAREGDKVKILRGQFKGKEGKIEKVDLKNTKLFITGIESVKKDGSKTKYPINPSNLMIIELNLSDKKRLKK